MATLEEVMGSLRKHRRARLRPGLPREAARLTDEFTSIYWAIKRGELDEASCRERFQEVLRLWGREAQPALLAKWILSPTQIINNRGPRESAWRAVGELLGLKRTAVKDLVKEHRDAAKQSASPPEPHRSLTTVGRAGLVRYALEALELPPDVVRAALRAVRTAEASSSGEGVD